MSSQEKTEKATSKKRRDERKKGNIFQSKDIVTVGTIAVAFYTLSFWMPNIYSFITATFKKYLTMPLEVTVVESSFMKEMFADMGKTVASVVGVAVAAIMITSIALAGAQTKFLVSREALKFKFSKLNPISGLKKMVSLKSLVELIKNMLKISVIGVVVYNIISDNLHYIPRLLFLDIENAIIFSFNVVMDVVNSVIIYFVAIAAVDYLYQWWEYEKNIKMSKQEVKDEYKNTEGNPEIKGKIKERQRKMSMTRMMQQVPNADVIVRNPTHFAVAIKYDDKVNRAPIVIAKGQDEVALKIIEIAESHNINITENKPLARALYKEVELNREIPMEYYEPMAEILAWVYKLKEKGK